jgi:F0F1-type ATP synthase alpha subunit
VKGLKRANRRDEAEIIAARKLARVDQLKSLNKDAALLYAHLEARVMALRQDWLEAVTRWETLRKESKLMRQANASREELTQEIRHAKALVKARKEAFFAAVEQLNYRALSYTR